MKNSRVRKQREKFHRKILRCHMGEQMVSSVVTVAVAIVGLAIIATLVSRNADTANVISAGGSAFSGALTAAEGPVLTNNFNVAGTFSNAGYHNV
jgi:hypothetical protein